MGRQREKRKKNIELRDELRNRPCLICQRPGENCHVKTFKTTQIDAEFNILSFCRTHHNLQHHIGFELMIERYPTVRQELIKLGWSWEKLFGKFVLYHLGLLDE